MDLPASRAVRISEEADCLDAIRRACDGELSLSVQSQPGLCAELTEQAGRRLVHLVNYRSDGAVKNVATRVRLSADRRAGTVKLVSPERKGDLDLPFEQDGGVVTFTVPEVGVYEIAVVTAE